MADISLEHASVDIGALTAGAEHLGSLLLREFALIYGNVWFQIPLLIQVGSDVSIDSLVMADTFGLTSIPHYAQADGTAGQWRANAAPPKRIWIRQFIARVRVVNLIPAS